MWSAPKTSVAELIGKVRQRRASVKLAVARHQRVLCHQGNNGYLKAVGAMSNKTPYEQVTFATSFVA